MHLYILRKGDGWALKYRHLEKRAEPESMAILTDCHLQRRVTDRFRRIAHGHGSHAVWLPQSGMLVTEYEAEQDRCYPYEAWRDQAINEAADAGQ